MNYPRFFCPLPLLAGALLELPANPAGHVARVLRLKVGDHLTLFNGAGGEFTACIVRIERASVQVRLEARHEHERESRLPLRLIQALQAGDKMDLTIQKATELGVSAIFPVLGRRSVVRLAGERAERRQAHWQGVAVAACEQCGRNRVPHFGALENLEQFLANPDLGAVLQGAAATPPAAAAELRLLLDPAASHCLHDLPRPAAVTLLVGAEGGFDPQEKSQAQQAGFIGVRLGPRILRTETAAWATLAAIHALWGDFRGENDV